MSDIKRPQLPRGEVGLPLAYPALSQTTERPVDTTNPVMSFALVSANPLVMEFAEEMDADFVPATTAFDVQKGGASAAITSVAVVGTAVKLTMTVPILGVDSLTVAYTKPTANTRLRDLRGNEVASFTATAVGNTTATWQYAGKTADETLSNSTTLQNDDDLLIALDANSYYAVECYLEYTTAITGTIAGIKAAFVLTGMGGLFTGYRVIAADTVPVPILRVAGTAADPFTASYNFATGDVVVITGSISTAGAGTLQLQWAQNVLSANSLTVGKRSYLRVLKLQ